MVVLGSGVFRSWMVFDSGWCGVVLNSSWCGMVLDGRRSVERVASTGGELTVARRGQAGGGGEG